MTSIEVLEIQTPIRHRVPMRVTPVLLKRGGRPKAITEQKVLYMIAKWQTASPSQLAEKLNVSRWTINRRLKQIPQEEIDQILEDLAHSELKPAHMEGYEVFKQLPIVREYEAKLVDKSEASPKYIKERLRSLWHICRVLKRKPSFLEIEECSALLIRVKRGDVIIQSGRGQIKMGVENAKKTVRSFFQVMHRISGEYLTSEGVDGSASAGTGKRATARLSMKQRHDFMRVLEEKVQHNWDGMRGKVKSRIAFGDKPDLAERMKVLPKAYYYWGARKMSVLDALIEDMVWDVIVGDHEFCVQKIVDKGRHKTGRSVWYKDTTGELLDDFKALWSYLGKPKEGLWFPFTKTQINVFFIECYEDAGIPPSLYKGMPLHLWRHTACQDLLDATNRNWELVAERLGWKSIDTMKKHYGKSSIDDLRKGQLEAMGYKVVWEKKEFRF